MRFLPATWRSGAGRYHPGVIPPPRRSALVLLLLAVPFAIAITRVAWLCDDAFYTLRVVDNLFSGYGLRWNVDERVQVYTHPLWMMALATASALTREYALTTVGLSLVCAVGAIVAAMACVRSLAARAAILVIALTSHAIVDFSTSGLETPLACLLVALQVLALQRAQGAARLLAVSACAALAMMTRLDLLLVTFPPALLAFIQSPRDRRSVLLGALGLAPLVAWEIFATIYYGSPLPNTYYAKMPAGIPRGDLVAIGARYLVESLHVDPLQWIAVGTALVAAAAMRTGLLLALATGIVLHLAYVVWIGGDYMSGRFVVIPFLAAAIGCGIALEAWTPARHGTRGTTLAAVLVVLAAFALVLARPFVRTPDADSALRTQGQVSDERAFYSAANDEPAGYRLALTLRGWRKGARFPSWPWGDTGTAERRESLSTPPRMVRVLEAGGIRAFNGGPKVHYIDVMGLGDPLLARLKPEWPARIGHLRRPVPEGYVESVRSGTNRIVDPSARALYEDIALLTRADLWSAERFAAILRRL